MASRRKSEPPALIGDLLSVCGIDPGAPPKTAFAWRGPAPLGWRVERKPPPGKFFDVAVAEKPTGVIRADRTPASIVSPAGWGMAALFSVGAVIRIWMPMEAWKEKLFPGGSRMRKAAFCANIKQMLCPGSLLDPEKDADQDELDAMGIAHATTKFAMKELKKWRVEW